MNFDVDFWDHHYLVVIGVFCSFAPDARWSEEILIIIQLPQGTYTLRPLYQIASRYWTMPLAKILKLSKWNQGEDYKRGYWLADHRVLTLKSVGDPRRRQD